MFQPAATTTHDAVEVDALIVGAGAAGMTAALVGALEGLDVLLCEKSGQVVEPRRPRPARSGCPARVKAAKPVSRTASPMRADISMR